MMRAVIEERRMNAMSPTARLFAAFEAHSPTDIRAALAAGADPHVRIDGKVAIEWLAEMYTRSSRFGECLQVLIDGGATFADPVLAPLLLDDTDALRAVLAAAPERARDRVFLECASLRCTACPHFTSARSTTRCAARRRCSISGSPSTNAPRSTTTVSVDTPRCSTPSTVRTTTAGR